MVAFVVHTNVGAFKDRKWRRFTSVIYQDENRVINSKEDREQALHELYQIFNAHCVELTTMSGSIITDIDKLFKTKHEGFLQILWQPISPNSDTQPDIVLETFQLYTSLEGLDDIPIQNESEQYWYDYAHNKHVTKNWDKVVNREVEVTSPWKKMNNGF